MARFSEYVDSSYLPGEVYNSGLDSIREDPQRVVDYLTDKKFKFKSAEDIGEAFPGASFQRFLNLQANPESLALNKMRTPQQFQLFSQLANLGT
jgi:hypothetical protein